MPLNKFVIRSVAVQLKASFPSALLVVLVSLFVMGRVSLLQPVPTFLGPQKQVPVLVFGGTCSGRASESPRWSGMYKDLQTAVRQAPLVEILHWVFVRILPSKSSI